MTTQTAVLQQINIIRVCDANADWSQAVGYEKGEILSPMRASRKQ